MLYRRFPGNPNDVLEALEGAAKHLGVWRTTDHANRAIGIGLRQGNWFGVSRWTIRVERRDAGSLAVATSERGADVTEADSGRILRLFECAGDARAATLGKVLTVDPLHPVAERSAEATQTARVLDPARVELLLTADSGPLTDDFCREYLWDSDSGAYVRYFLRRRYAEEPQDIEEYLDEVERRCRAFIGMLTDPHEVLDIYRDVAHQYSQARVLMDSFARVQSDAVRRVGVLDVGDEAPPPFLFPIGHRQLAMKPGGRFWIDTVLNFGEFGPRPLSGVPMGIRRSYSFKLSLDGESATLGIACLLANDHAPARHSFETHPAPKDAGGSFLPLLDPREFRVAQLSNGDYLAGVLNRHFGTAANEIHDFLSVSINDDLQTMNLEMNLRLPGMQLRDQDLVAYLRAVHRFEAWVRSRK